MRKVAADAWFTRPDTTVLSREVSKSSFGRDPGTSEGRSLAASLWDKTLLAADTLADLSD